MSILSVSCAFISYCWILKDMLKHLRNVADCRDLNKGLITWRQEIKLLTTENETDEFDQTVKSKAGNVSFARRCNEKSQLNKSLEERVQECDMTPVNTPFKLNLRTIRSWKESSPGYQDKTVVSEDEGFARSQHSGESIPTPIFENKLQQKLGKG